MKWRTLTVKPKPTMRAVRLRTGLRVGQGAPAPTAAPSPAAGQDSKSRVLVQVDNF